MEGAVEGARLGVREAVEEKTLTCRVKAGVQGKDGGEDGRGYGAVQRPQLFLRRNRVSCSLGECKAQPHTRNSTSSPHTHEAQPGQHTHTKLNIIGIDTLPSCRFAQLNNRILFLEFH